MSQNLYEHTQPGRAIRWVLGGMGAFFLVLPTLLPVEATWFSWSLALVGTSLLLVLLLFHSLQVWVGENGKGDPQLGISYGIGLVRKTFSLSNLRRAERCKTSWLDGWGIHRTPKGWLYNISGFDAVELEFEDQRWVGIGTDDPEGLLHAIEEVSRGHE